MHINDQKTSPFDKTRGPHADCKHFAYIKDIIKKIFDRSGRCHTKSESPGRWPEIVHVIVNWQTLKYSEKGKKERNQQKNYI